MRARGWCLAIIAVFATLLISPSTAEVRLKELGRFDGVRENELIGYGLVVGLAGTGDTPANRATLQSIANTLIDFGVNVDLRDLRSRNTAAVMVTAILPPFVNKGDRIDVSVASLGDARSLAGGTLFLTPVYGPDEKLYALAQGQLTVGGFSFSSFDSVYQKNHPTVGVITNGATVERSVEVQVIDDNGELFYLLDNPDFITAQKVIDSARSLGPGITVDPIHAGRIRFRIAGNDPGLRFATMARIQQLAVTPDAVSRIVINERTGTIVAGGNVTVSAVAISHENIKLEIDTQYQVSQPNIGFFAGRGADVDLSGVRTVVVPQTKITVESESGRAVQLSDGTTVADLINSLADVNVSTRDIIVILQSIKRAGALQADIVVE